MLIRRGDESFRALAAALRDGRVVAAACDTIYGFLGIVPDCEADIRRIKGRGETKPFLILIHDTDALKGLGVQGTAHPILSLWPGPFTFIFPTASGKTIAARVPEDRRLRSLIAQVGLPLFSTSVNRAGESPMDDPVRIHDEFGGETALVEDSGVLRGRKPSTIVDLSVHPHRVLRPGAGTVPREYLGQEGSPNPMDQVPGPPGMPVR